MGYKESNVQGKTHGMCDKCLAEFERRHNMAEENKQEIKCHRCDTVITQDDRPTCNNCNEYEARTRQKTNDEYREENARLRAENERKDILIEELESKIIGMNETADRCSQHLSAVLEGT